jgi:hypothetical protein
VPLARMPGRCATASASPFTSSPSGHMSTSIRSVLTSARGSSAPAPLPPA